MRAIKIYIALGVWDRMTLDYREDEVWSILPKGEGMEVFWELK
jgi:hypothetical protein